MIFQFIRLKVVNRPGVLNRVTQVVLKPRYNFNPSRDGRPGDFLYYDWN